jgi:predicted methyltransferase
MNPQITPIFSHYQTKPLLASHLPDIISLSTDLGLSTIQARHCTDGWLLATGDVLTHTQIEKISQEENSCYTLHNGEITKVEIFSPATNRYYSLMPTEEAPTMLISGIPMHRIKATTPMMDTRQKIKALGKPYGHILDTTMGLGYTAIMAAKTALSVVTIEFDPAVLTICQSNPWSAGLFTHPAISRLIGDSYDLVEIFPDETFNAILHDPPTFNLAGQLYSQDIYDSFYRILKPSGRLFHYIGNPESRTGASVGKGVVERLKRAGFSVAPKDRAFGVLAQKSTH